MLNKITKPLHKNLLLLSLCLQTKKDHEKWNGKNSLLLEQFHCKGTYKRILKNAMVRNSLLFKQLHCKVPKEATGLSVKGNEEIDHVLDINRCIMVSFSILSF